MFNETTPPVFGCTMRIHGRAVFDPTVSVAILVTSSSVAVIVAVVDSPAFVVRIGNVAMFAPIGTSTVSDTVTDDSLDERATMTDDAVQARRGIQTYPTGSHIAPRDLVRRHGQIDQSNPLDLVDGLHFPGRFA